MLSLSHSRIPYKHKIFSESSEIAVMAFWVNYFSSFSLQSSKFQKQIKEALRYPRLDIFCQLLSLTIYISVICYLCLLLFLDHHNSEVLMPVSVCHGLFVVLYKISTLDPRVLDYAMATFEVLKFTSQSGQYLNLRKVHYAF